MRLARITFLAAAILLPTAAVAQPAPLDPQKKFTITLDVRGWRAVLQALSAAPYRDVAALISDIDRQIGQQSAQDSAAAKGAAEAAEKMKREMRPEKK